MNNLLLKKDLSAEQLSMINSEMNNKQKSKGIAYLIWFFLGGLGGHRYYAGDIEFGNCYDINFRWSWYLVF